MQLDSGSLDRQRIQALKLWQGPITLSPLSGGMTNHNFLVEDGARTVVARVCAPLPILGIDRRNEVLCQRAARDLGIAPDVVHEEDGILISEYVEARTMSAEDVRKPGFVTRLAGVLRALHSGTDQLTGEMLYFCVFQTIRTYAKTFRMLSTDSGDDLDEPLEDALRLSRRIGPYKPTLCHNDLLPANILDDGRKISIVDWEYAGIGHPLFDLAGVSANCGLSDSLEREFLAAYRDEATAREVDLQELRILKTMSLLREALWAMIQMVNSKIDFDYTEYADRSLQAYLKARKELGNIYR